LEPLELRLGGRGHVACVRKRELFTKLWLENSKKEKDKSKKDKEEEDEKKRIHSGI
jgi:hypothetical protein